MAYDDRWRYDRPRAETSEREPDYRRENRRYATDYDRDRERGRFAGRRSSSLPYGSDDLGRGSRDDYGFDQDDRYGAGTSARNDYRTGFDESGLRLGSDRYQGSRDIYDRDRSAFGRERYEGDPGHRGMSERAFGRPGSFGGEGRDRGFARDADRRDRGFFERAGDEVASWFGDDDAERRRRQDARYDAAEDRFGEHRGRGPKSYQRSDDRVREDVNDRLTDDYRLDASEIEVAVTGREVTLSGTVTSRADKRRAEDLADSVSGVTHVQNNLRVQSVAEGGSAAESRDRFGSGLGTGTSPGSTTGLGAAGSSSAGSSPTGSSFATRAGDKTTV